MKLKIVGSGGMSIIPSSFCASPICGEAREKGGRYERLGPSLYIEDIKMLIDTPEDIAVACNRQRISEVKRLSISHHDPDHVKGIRIVEKIGYDFIAEKASPIDFYALPAQDPLQHQKVIVTHIDEMWGKSYGYYRELEKTLDNIFFAYDGMEITL